MAERIRYTGLPDSEHVAARMECIRTGVTLADYRRDSLREKLSGSPMFSALLDMVRAGRQELPPAETNEQITGK